MSPSTNPPEPPGWGAPPWQLASDNEEASPPSSVELAIVGGGFTGLATACWLRRLAPERSVAVLEAYRFGAGGSGRTGGVVLDDSAGGELPGLGQVLPSLVASLRELDIECGLRLTGVWEISRRFGRPDSPIAWQDSGLLRVAHHEPGGWLDPGRLLTGLVRRAREASAHLCERAPVRRIHFEEPLRLELARGELRARHALLAVNGSGLDLLDWLPRDHARFTLAVATAPFAPNQLRRLGLSEGRPFYTLDLPYLWGRPLGKDRFVFGGGLVSAENAEAMRRVEVTRGEPAERLASLERRIRGLVPGLDTLSFTHRWGGPILFSPGGRPVFCFHPESPRALVLGGYTGQGIALSIHLARWAAEVLLGRRQPPAWGRPAGY